jgi:hypothetical protein
MTSLIWELDTLFLYLSNATMCIPGRFQKQVFQDMAYKLMEWEGVTRTALRPVMVKYGFPLEELCSNCNEVINAEEGAEEITEEDPRCSNCQESV